MHAWCTSGAHRCMSIKIIARFVRVWDKKFFLTCLKIFYKLGVSRACDLYVSNKFHAHYRHVEYASNAFGARLRHASVRSTHAPIL